MNDLPETAGKNGENHASIRRIMEDSLGRRFRQ